MKYTLLQRKREILGTATTIYESVAETTYKNLEALNLPTVAVQTAIGNIGVIRERLATTGTDVEIQEDLRITAHDALVLMSMRIDKVKKEQLKLTIPTGDVDETEEEVDDLARVFAEQPVLL